MGVATKLLHAGAIAVVFTAASLACSATLVGVDSAEAPPDGAVIPGDDGGGDASASSSSGSGGPAGCAAIAMFPPAAFDFGAVRTKSTASGRVVLRNLGAAPISVTVSGLAAPYALVSRSSFDVLPQVPANVDFSFTPMVPDAQAVAKITLKWPGCEAGIAVRGIGSDAELLVNPATLNLGSAPCGEAVAGGQVTINSAIPTTYTAQIEPPFTTLPGPFDVPASVPFNQSIEATAFAPGAAPATYERTLQLAFVGGTTRTVKVLAESIGGVVDVGNVTLNPTGIAMFRNNGNQLVSVMLLEAGLGFTPSTFNLASGATQNVTITKTSMMGTTFQVKVNVTAGRNCGGTPFFLVSVQQ